MLTRLRQICCEPRIIYDNISNISSKLSGCLDLIRNFLGNNQKVLLFSSFTSVLDLIAKELEKESITYYQLTGDTKKEERHRLVNQFQNDDTTVFLISLKAGGTGLNLQLFILILGGICQHKIRRLIVLIESGKKML